MALELLGFTLGASFASGLNLYSTVTVLGLLQRFGVIELPPALHVLAEPVVLLVAAGLYCLEFFADKIPWLDTAWDSVHAFIPPPAAALLAYSAFWGVPEAWRVAAALLAGTVALTSHGAKASARVAINASPEPMTNWSASLIEDGTSVFLAWIAAAYPVATIGIVVVLMFGSVYLLAKLWRGIRKATGRPHKVSSGLPR